MAPDLEQLAADTLRTLAMDAVQKAKSGHPGMPMGMADIAVVLWGRFLTVDPAHPTWPDRDRFVLSNGHGSMLLYGLLHLAGFPMTIEDLKSFRQLGSRTPGHPERDPEMGIEVTTGPLGQGFGMGVGMAIAEEHLRAIFGSDLVDHRTYGCVSDGDLMEGLSAESSSLAGHLGLGRLIYFYDDNDISIDGSTSIAFSEDVPARFRAIGWHVDEVEGHDRVAIEAATTEALSIEDRPSLIVCHTHIAYGAPNAQDTAKAHGAPLGEEEVRQTKEAMGWNPDQQFFVPPEAYDFFHTAMERGRDARARWEERRSKLKESDPDQMSAWEARLKPGTVELTAPSFSVGASTATRSASGDLFDQIAEKVPGFVGGAADLVESTKTHISKGGYFARDNRQGRNLAFGVREHAMGAIVIGLSLHGGLRAYGSTFLIFSDYMRPSIRLSALMEAPSLWVFTHDSIWLGEDGPTHQPIEHIPSLRAIPNLWVVRPGDAGETVEAWELALNRHDGPTALLLTRQGLPVLNRSGREGMVSRGAYALREGSDLSLWASGSELHLALEAAAVLEGEHRLSVKVVSVPCLEAFESQAEGYQDDLMPLELPTLFVEASRTVGSIGTMRPQRFHHLGLDRFGASAPGDDVAKALGMSTERVVEESMKLLGG